MSLPLFIARRYFASKKGYLFVSFLNFIAILGVALGVFAMIVVLSVMTGFSRDLQDKLVGFNAHVRVGGVDRPNLEEFRRKLGELAISKDVTDVEDYIEGEVILEQEGATTETAQGAKVRGVRPPLSFPRSLSPHVVSGERESSENNGSPIKALGDDNLDNKFLSKGKTGLPKIIAGSEILSYLGIHPKIGGYLRLTAPFGSIDPLGNVKPNIRVYQLDGDFRSGYFEYDSKFVLMDMEEARRLLGLQARGGYFIWLKDLRGAEDFAAALSTALGDRYEVKSWSLENKKLFRALKLERIGMSVLLILIILIASFSVVSIVLMLVFSKEQDIAMLKALGMEERRIEKIFMYKGLMIGAIGTLVGLLTGLGFCHMLRSYKISLPSSYYLDYLPVEVNGLYIVTICLAGLVIALLASIYPARQAMHVNTAAVLRYE